MTSRRQFLSALSAPLLGAAQGNEAPLNFVFILIDDLGWMDTGFSGSRFYETPAIDHLAQRSVRFTNAYAACPVCSPSRAAILTGKYPARLHLTDYIRPEPKPQPYWELLPGADRSAVAARGSDHRGGSAAKGLCLGGDR
jgi:hypothetical protein